MADPRFFVNHGPFRLAELADIGGADLVNPDDGERPMTDIAPLDLAGQADLSFLDNTAYLDAFAVSRAGACVLAPEHVARAPDGMALLVAKQPYSAYARMAQAFYPGPVRQPGLADRAVVDATARLGKDVAVGQGAVIGPRAEIGAHCVICANVTIGDGVVLGENCTIGANASLSHCIVGARVSIYPGVRIGQGGFGFAPDPTGYLKVPQVGRVLIGDDCEIGANTTIDRGANRDTIIGDGCWIDNLVQIGHNVELGRGCIVVAMAGISGSTKLGDFVQVGGQVGITGHRTIGAGARLAAKSGVMTDVPAGATYSGVPAMPIKEHFRQVATLKQLVQRRGQNR